MGNYIQANKTCEEATKALAVLHSVISSADCKQLAFLRHSSSCIYKAHLMFLHASTDECSQMASYCFGCAWQHCPQICSDACTFFSAIWHHDNGPFVFRVEAMYSMGNTCWHTLHRGPSRSHIPNGEQLVPETISWSCYLQKQLLSSAKR